MDKCLIIPDSFKGTLTAIDVCSTIEKSISEVYPHCRTRSFPISDGGEGTVDCFMHAWANGQKVKINTTGPLGEIVNSFYGLFGKVAIIEMAASAGMGIIKELDPLRATTYGVGQLILDAVYRGCSTIILGLGGSCTNDGGAGMAAALGTKFYNREGEEFIPTGGTLSDIKHIDKSHTDMLLNGVKVRAMCDISNPMIGPNGAARIFAPQKGATVNIVDILEKNMIDFASIIEKEFGLSLAELPGAGAAGALGAGALAFLEASLEKGIDVVLDIIDFESEAEGCDVIFTGEGKLDRQSLGGKAVIGIANRAKALDIPVVAVVGTVGDDISDEKKSGLRIDSPIFSDYGITRVYATTKEGLPSEVSSDELKNFCKERLWETMSVVLSDLKTDI